MHLFFYKGNLSAHFNENLKCYFMLKKNLDVYLI